MTAPFARTCLCTSSGVGLTVPPRMAFHRGVHVTTRFRPKPRPIASTRSIHDAATRIYHGDGDMETLALSMEPVDVPSRESDREDSCGKAPEAVTAAENRARRKAVASHPNPTVAGAFHRSVHRACAGS